MIGHRFGILPAEDYVGALIDMSSCILCIYAAEGLPHNISSSDLFSGCDAALPGCALAHVVESCSATTTNRPCCPATDESSRASLQECGEEASELP